MDELISVWMYSHLHNLILSESLIGVPSPNSEGRLLELTVLWTMHGFAFQNMLICWCEQSGRLIQYGYGVSTLTSR